MHHGVIQRKERNLGLLLLSVGVRRVLSTNTQGLLLSAVKGKQGEKDVSGSGVLQRSLPVETLQA